MSERIALFALLLSAPLFMGITYAFQRDECLPLQDFYLAIAAMYAAGVVVTLLFRVMFSVPLWKRLLLLPIEWLVAAGFGVEIFARRSGLAGQNRTVLIGYCFGLAALATVALLAAFPSRRAQTCT